jgi:hypothetical protein
MNVSIFVTLHSWFLLLSVAFPIRIEKLEYLRGIQLFFHYREPLTSLMGTLVPKYQIALTIIIILCENEEF